MWEQVFFEAIEAGSGERKRLGSGAEPRTCAFCKKRAPDVTFRKQAHVVPQAFGNRTLLSREECDACNEAAGAEVEEDLVKLLSGARIGSVVGPRRPQWTFRHRTGSASAIRVRPSSRALHFAPAPGDPSVRLSRTPEGLKVAVKIPPYRPYNVARALGRIAWFVMPDDLRGLADHVRRWVVGVEQWSSIPIFLGSLKAGPGSLKGPVIALSIPKRGLSDRGAWFDIRLSLGRTVLAALIPGPSLDLDAIEFRDGKMIEARPHVVDSGLRYSLQFSLEELATKLPPSREEIARAAYYRFRARAGQNGDAGTDWLEAEQDLLWLQLEPHGRTT